MRLTALSITPCVLALGATLCLGVTSAGASTEASGPPAWFKEHLAYITAGDGVWVADNRAYQSDEEPADAYEITFVWGAGKQTAAGTMRAITDGEHSGAIWDFRSFWDPSTRRAMIQQHSFWGAYAIGDTRMIDATTFRSEQAMFGPDGTKSKTAHDWIVDSSTQHTTHSFTWENGAWKPGRTYVWKRGEAR